MCMKKIERHEMTGREDRRHYYFGLTPSSQDCAFGLNATCPEQASVEKDA